MEVLSPVKNLVSAKVAIMSGADAIYFSSNIFGARENAKNTHSEVSEIVKFAKLHYTKTYVTLNTVIKTEELPLFFSEVNYLHSIGVDGIILQDFSLIEVVSNAFEDMEVHCSTQMNIGNSFAAKFVKKLGSNRVVISRELNIEEVKDIVNVGIETEVFVHGALCTSYSGLCMISSIESNLSGNRGKCSQFCRMETLLYKDGVVLNPSEYILSFKDLNASSSIEKLASIGVSSIKIEGRLKQQEYIGLTTNIYRKLVDKVACNTSGLSKVYNREFTAGYLNSSNDINNSKRINNSGYYVGRVIKQDNKWVYIECEKNIMHLDKIRFIKGDFETGQTIDVIERTGNNGFRIKSRYSNLANCSVYVVNSFAVKSALKKGALNCYKKQIYKLDVNMKLGSRIEVICKNKKYYSKSALDFAKTLAVSKDKVLKQLSKTNDYPFDFYININYEAGFIQISELNAIRRQIYEDIKKDLLNVVHQDIKFEYKSVKEKLSESTLYIEIRNTEQLNELVHLDKSFILVISDDSLLNNAKKLFKKVYKLFPSVVSEEYIECYDIDDEYDGVVISELGGLERLKNYNKPVVSHYSLNTTNIINQQMLLKYCYKTILSVENKYGDLSEFNLSKSIGFLYGYIDVMYMKYCPLNKSKIHSCGSCSICCDNKYEIEINNIRYRLLKQNYDKLALLSSKPIYNSQLLEYSMDYYIRFTDEENVSEVIENIFSKNITCYSDTYLKDLK